MSSDCPGCGRRVEECDGSRFGCVKPHPHVAPQTGLTIDQLRETLHAWAAQSQPSHEGKDFLPGDLLPAPDALDEQEFMDLLCAVRNAMSDELFAAITAVQSYVRRHVLKIRGEVTP